MGSFLQNLHTTLLKLISLLKSNAWVSNNFGILKSLLKPYHLLGNCFGIGFLLRITYLGDKLRLTMIFVPSIKANLSLPLICSSHVVQSCLCGGNSIHGCHNQPFSGRAMRDSRVRVPRTEYALRRHQLLFEENVGKTGKDVIYEL